MGDEPGMQGDRVTGGCLCGAVRFSAPRVMEFGICHCKQCQRWTGGMFPGIMYPVSGVTIDGSAHVVDYASSADATRSFCGICGSTLWFRTRPGSRTGDRIEIAAGLLDDPDGLSLTHEVFVDVAPDAWTLAGDHIRDTRAEYHRKVAEADRAFLGDGAE